MLKVKCHTVTSVITRDRPIYRPGKYIGISLSRCW